MSDGKGKEPDVVFVGDSLVQLMHQFGVNVIMYLIYYFIKKNSCNVFFYFFLLQIWRELFSPLHSLNFGVGGDATQHVLWRLINGELDSISPKV